MGMPLYGQAFTLNNPSEHGLNAPARQKGTAGEFTRAAGFLAYYEICNKIKTQNWAVVQDSHGPDHPRMGPYAYKDRQWVSYDDVAMIKYKVSMIKQGCLKNDLSLILSELKSQSWHCNPDEISVRVHPQDGPCRRHGLGSRP